jgi:hypothetical protein
VKTCCAAGAVPLLAVTVIPGNVPVPAEVGVPERTPLLVRVRPGGSAPLVRLNVGAGWPLAVKVCEYAAPTVSGEGGGLLVKAGGVPPHVTAQT